MKKVIQILILITVFWAGCVVSGLMLVAQPKDEPKPYYVTDKAEVDGRCYVQTWVDVTPEEYIGLDVGDEFEVTE